MFAVLILLAQLVTFGSTYRDDPKFKEWFETAKFGERFSYSRPSGCNTCYGEVQKISKTEVRDWGESRCTLVNCYMGEVIKIK